MKIRLLPLLILFTAISFSFGYTENQNKPGHNIKFIHTLKDKKGHLLGKVYIEDFKNDVFRKLLITKKEKGKTDTLYFINDCLFTNPKGVDIQFDKKAFNGYKIEYLKNDTIQLFGIGKGSAGASDPATIVWNYNKKIFEVFKTP
jgi:hypothetical protein